MKYSVKMTEYNGLRQIIIYIESNIAKYKHHLILHVFVLRRKYVFLCNQCPSWIRQLFVNCMSKIKSTVIYSFMLHALFTEKGRDLTQSYGKSTYTFRKIVIECIVFYHPSRQWQQLMTWHRKVWLPDTSHLRPMRDSEECYVLLLRL